MRLLPFQLLGVFPSFQLRPRPVLAHSLQPALATRRTEGRGLRTRGLQLPTGHAALPRRFSIGLLGVGIRREVAMGLRPGCPLLGFRRGSRADLYLGFR